MVLRSKQKIGKKRSREVVKERNWEDREKSVVSKNLVGFACGTRKEGMVEEWYAQISTFFKYLFLLKFYNLFFNKK